MKRGKSEEELCQQTCRPSSSTNTLDLCCQGLPTQRRALSVTFARKPASELASSTRNPTNDPWLASGQTVELAKEPCLVPNSPRMSEGEMEEREGEILHNQMEDIAIKEVIEGERYNHTTAER